MKPEETYLNDLTDSRILLESKPNKLTSIFIYTVLVLIALFLTWTWIAEKEVVVKANGILRTAQPEYVVSNRITGQVKNVFFENGEKINKDKVLFEIENSQLQNQKDELEINIKNVAKHIDNLNLLIESVNNNENYFNEDDEKDFFYKYESYSKENAVINEDKNSLIANKNELTAEVENLKNFINSIETHKNNNTSDRYIEEYNNFSISKQALEEYISDLNNSKSNLQNKKNKLTKVETKAIDEEISQIEREIENKKIELLQLQSDYKLSAQTSLDELNKQIVNIDTNIQQDKEEHELSKEKRKLSTLSQLEDELAQNNTELDKLKLNLEIVDKNIDQTKIRAPFAGKLDVITDLKPGTILQEGQVVGKMIPNSDTYIIDLLVPEKDIANLEVGQEIKYNFNSLSFKEYGFLKGYIESISANSQIDDQTNQVYYLVRGTVKSNVLYNKQGQEKKIIPGMQAEGRVITQKKRMLFYLLEKLNFKN